MAAEPAPGEGQSVLDHELRGPLTVIKAAAELARRFADEVPPSVQQLIRVIDRNAAQACRLVDRRDLARQLRSGEVALRPEPLDLVLLAMECCEDLAHTLLREHPTRLEGASEVDVVADPEAVREILFNLLANAARHGHPQGEVTVTVEADDRTASVAVRDHGPGLSGGLGDAAFDAFAQADASGPGCGLGLYICRGLARAHGGDVTARSPEGGGAEFVLVLPRRPTGR